MTASVWNPGTTPLVSGESSLQFQRFVATAAQEVFTLTAFAYVVGANSLLVFKNGQILALESDFEEINSSSFSLVVPATLNDIIYAVGFVEVTDSTGTAIAAAAAAAASAVEAGVSATEAEAALTSAEAVLVSTQAVLAEFETLYLGAKATPPTLDNAGNPLADGALYWDTVDKSLYVYDLATTSWNAPDIPPGLLQSANNLSDLADATTARINLGVAIGTDVQAYDAATAKTNAAQTFTLPQRGSVLTDNDGNLDLGAKQNFTVTPTAAMQFQFTNIVAGQCGNIYLVNGSNYAITRAAYVKVTAELLAAISVTGNYWLGYYSPDGTNVLLSGTGALS